MPDLDQIHDAISASAATRDRVKALSPGDASRRAALDAALAGLKAAWTAEHVAHCRRGPQRDKATYKTDDPVRVAGRDRDREMRRLRSMLKPTSGTPRAAPDETYTYTQMFGRIGRMRQVLYIIREDHKTVRRVLGGGGPQSRRGRPGTYTGMADFNAEARDLLDRVHAERREVADRHRAYLRGDFSEYDAQDERHQIARMLATARNEAAILATELRASVNRRRPLTARERGLARERWPEDRCREALSAYHGEHGHWPTADELRRVSTLPHYTTLRRLWGPRFIGRLDTIVASATT